jgi:hypothetical protein
MGSAGGIAVGCTATATQKLFDAAWKDKPILAKQALKGKASCYDQERLERHTPLHIAARNAFAAVVDVLLQHIESTSTFALQQWCHVNGKRQIWRYATS